MIVKKEGEEYQTKSIESRARKRKGEEVWVSLGKRVGYRGSRKKIKGKREKTPTDRGVRGFGGGLRGAQQGRDGGSLRGGKFPGG